MKIGDEVYVHGFIDEIRNDVIIIRNDGGYFGTAPSEVVNQEPNEDKRTDKRTGTHACNCIKRQATIYALRAMQTYKLGAGEFILENSDYTEAVEEVLDMAIEALEQEPIRCKDCKHFNDGDCEELPKIVSETDFCSFAERK